MSDRMRHAICRAVFLLACVIPTCLTGGWAAWAHRARAVTEAREHWEARLLGELGLVTRIERVLEDTDDEVAFEGVAFFDPESGQPVATAKEIHATRAGTRGWLLEIHYPQVAIGALPRLWTPIGDRLRHARGEVDWSGLVVAHHMTLRGVDGDHTLSDVECQFRSGATGSEARIRFAVDGLNMSERASLSISRTRRERSAETRVTFRTGPTPLPCSLLAHAIPAASRLGLSAHFLGSTDALRDDSAWRVERLSGRLTDVDFFHLVTEAFPNHLLTGVGSIDIREASFDGGRLIGAEGSVAIPSGIASRSLVSAAETWLHWTIGDKRADADRVPFRELAFDFTIDASGLAVRGDRGEPPIVVLTDRGPITVDREQRIPVTDVLRFLVPDSAHHVPATRQTAWLAGLLPVPSITLERVPDRPPANPPLRLGNGLGKP